MWRGTKNPKNDIYFYFKTVPLGDIMQSSRYGEGNEMLKDQRGHFAWYRAAHGKRPQPSKLSSVPNYSGGVVAMELSIKENIKINPCNTQAKHCCDAMTIKVTRLELNKWRNLWAVGSLCQIPLCSDDTVLNRNSKGESQATLKKTNGSRRQTIVNTESVLNTVCRDWRHEHVKFSMA